MKKFKKIMAVLVAAMMIMAMAVPAWAATSAHPVTIKFENGNAGATGTQTSIPGVVPANSDYAWVELPNTTTFQLTDNTFAGWARSDDATNTPIDRLLITDTDDEITLKALWDSNKGATSGTNFDLTSTGVIKINNSVAGETYNAYQLFHLYSWKDLNILPDQHAKADEQYSYYIENYAAYNDEFAPGAQGANPDEHAKAQALKTWYEWLDAYTYKDASDADKDAFEFDAARKVTIGGKEYVPVKATDGFMTYADENRQEEYQDLTNARIQAFAQAALAQINSNVILATELKKGTQEGNGSAITISALPLGYYLVDSTLGSLCSLDTTNSTAYIIEKNEFSTVAKVVTENSTSQTGDKNDANIGDTVTFTSTVTIPLQQKSVIYHDRINTTAFKLTGITSIKVGNTALSAATDYEIYEEAAEATFKTTNAPEASKAFPKKADNETIKDVFKKNSGTDTFAIEFTNDYLKTLTAETTDVTIIYTAQLLPAATDGLQSDKATGAGNDNMCWVTYGADQISETDWTRTYTYSFDIFKYTRSTLSTSYATSDDTYTTDTEAHKAGYVRSESNEAGEKWVKVDRLPGAKFIVSKIATTQSGTTGSYTYTDGSATALRLVLETAATGSTDANVYRPYIEGTDQASAIVEYLITPASGFITIRGLDANGEFANDAGKLKDKYLVQESEAPIGYDKLHYDINLTLTSDTDATNQGDDNTQQDDNTLTITANDSPVGDIAIENFTGTELPSTGGAGTTVLYIVGGMLVILAGAYLFFSRKKTA